MCVEEGGDGSASGVARHEKGTAAAGGVFLEEGAEAGCDGADHFARNGEEAGVAEIAGIVLRRCVSLFMTGDIAWW